MGIYDRDYERSYDQGGGWRPEGQGGVQLRWPVTAIGWVLLVTFAVYVVELLLQRDSGANPLVDNLHLDSHWYLRPWRVYGLLTYGFLHAPNDFFHIAWNMFSFWLFGRQLEQRYGSREFLAFYLAAIVFAGLAFTLSHVVYGQPGFVIGASGGTVAVTILFALLYPHVRVLFMFFIPMPMWVLGLIIVAMDLQGAVTRSGQVAFTAHLGGAAFALLYFRQRWRLAEWLPDRLAMPSFKRRPKLRVHRGPDQDSGADSLEEQVDAILAKIQAQGQDSLTRKERRILEQASRRAKQRRS